VDPLDDFDAFYRANVRGVLAFFARRTRHPELAADLTAETFAAALAGRRRFDPTRGNAVQWLYGIANHQLQHALARGRADDRLRRRLGIEVPTPDDTALVAIDRLASGDAHAALVGLPEPYRAAVRARVVDEQPYAQIALDQNASPALIRKRVSRGLAALRGRVRREEPR
jgi:RNA polymerase sigma factor (sigma-70 family)